MAGVTNLLAVPTESPLAKVIDWSNPIVAGSCSPKIQELIILPTEQCNFRCTYCYEDFMVGAMPVRVQESIERFLDKRIPELQQLNLSWFGGEPLAARKAVLRIAGHAKKVCDAFGVNLTGGLTTNAWLLDLDLFEQLLALDQRFFQITLDGWGAEHDLYRRKANGGPTFDRIWQNLLSYRTAQGNFSVQLRIHVRRESWRSLDVLIAAVAENFGNDPRFSIDLQHIRDLGGDGGKTVIAPFSLKELKVVEAELRSIYAVKIKAFHPHIETLSSETEAASSLVSELSDSPIVGESGHQVCYAARPNSLLIRADGRIGKCTVALSDDRNTIGEIRPDGSVQIDSRKLQPWVRGMTSLDEMELACPLVGLMS